MESVGALILVDFALRVRNIDILQMSVERIHLGMRTVTTCRLAYENYNNSSSIKKILGCSSFLQQVTFEPWQIQHGFSLSVPAIIIYLVYLYIEIYF
jgi:hypothetical protein